MPTSLLSAVCRSGPSCLNLQTKLVQSSPNLFLFHAGQAAEWKIHSCGVRAPAGQDDPYEQQVPGHPGTGDS